MVRRRSPGPRAVRTRRARVTGTRRFPHYRELGPFYNKDNDTSSGTWSNSSGLSGSFGPSGPTIFDRLNGGLQPNSETKLGTGPNSTNPTKYQFTQTLQPDGSTGNFYQGREVIEGTGAPGNDSCWLKSSKSYPGGPFVSVSKTGWAVGYPGNLTTANSNTYGPDVIGWPPLGVAWYRQNLPPSAFPCTATIYQNMYAIYTSGTNPLSTYGYIHHTFTVIINSSSLEFIVDGYTYILNR